MISILTALFPRKRQFSTFSFLDLVIIMNAKNCLMLIKAYLRKIFLCKPSDEEALVICVCLCTNTRSPINSKSWPCLHCLSSQCISFHCHSTSKTSSCSLCGGLGGFSHLQVGILLHYSHTIIAIKTRDTVDKMKYFGKMKYLSLHSSFREPAKKLAFAFFSKLQYRGCIIKCSLCFAELFCIPGCSLKRREAAGADDFQLLVPACGAGRCTG